MLRHETGLFSLSEDLADSLRSDGLLWILDFIAANQKRVKKLVPGVQEWVFSFDDQHRAVLKVFSLAVLHPQHRKLHFTFNFTITPYHGEPVYLYLDDGMLMTKGERDASL